MSSNEQEESLPLRVTHRSSLRFSPCAGVLQAGRAFWLDSAGHRLADMSHIFIQRRSTTNLVATSLACAVVVMPAQGELLTLPQGTKSFWRERHR